MASFHCLVLTLIDHIAVGTLAKCDAIVRIRMYGNAQTVLIKLV